jgi:hypothetical protein
MAPPSRVPGTDGLVRYGPTATTAVADLPAAYVDAWTPRQDPARLTRQQAPVSAGRAEVAASYVHARIEGIAGDLAALKPGGRNTAIYTAALKVGSTLASARSTPGAEQAAAAWTDQAAEDALMAAAEQNGYVGDHSATEARSAVRSGLRNGLRNPRPLPEFGRSRVTPSREHQRSRGELERRGSGASTSEPIGLNPASSRGPSKVGSPRPSVAPSHREPRSGQVPESKEAGAPESYDSLPRFSRQTETADWRNAIALKECEKWQPKVLSNPDQAVTTEPAEPEIER